MESLSVVVAWEQEQPDQSGVINHEYLIIFSGEFLEFGDRINRIRRFGNVRSDGPGGGVDDEVGRGFDGAFGRDRVAW